ncbi:MAG: peptide chain release factor 2 [Bacilli bacterium]|nr:peptide chain release factor 2 [Bacilli bacterium]
MDIKELKKTLDYIKKRLKNYGGFFDVNEKKEKIEKFNVEMNDSNFWIDKENAEKIIEESNNLKKSVEQITKLRQNIDDNLEMLSLLDSTNDEEVVEFIVKDFPNIDKRISSLTLEIMLNGLNDKNDALLEIHAGAGGTESCDWASMLMRMYLRWCDLKKYKYEVIDTQNGDEAGIKSVVILVKGHNAYGYLKSEKGVHRLVRISPFDSNKRRHTSFASVEVIPQIDNDINIDIKESDLKIDVYRSSGAGGQGVNTTDSAVRITHVPTGTVVTCQNERSQIKNKEKAIQVLKSKLHQLEELKRNQSISELKGNQMGINFGSQIRSYVMHPYMMVKDHRTEFETSNVLKVLEGDIDIFIESYWKGNVKNGK